MLSAKSAKNRRYAAGFAGALALASMAGLTWRFDRSGSPAPRAVPLESPSPVESARPASANDSRLFGYEVTSWEPERSVSFSALWDDRPKPPMGLGLGQAPAADEAAEKLANDRFEDFSGRTRELVADWRALDQSQLAREPWDHFLQSWVDPLLVESDGVSFYDPAGDPVKSVLPVNRPRAYGFGIKFRTSF